MPLIRNLALAAMVLSVSACATGTIIRSDDAYKAATDSADWNSATVIDIDLVDDHFSPMLLKMKQGKPYVLRIINKDREVYSLAAGELNESMAYLRGSDDEELSSVQLKSFEPAEIKVIPMHKGRFEFHRAGMFDFLSLILPNVGAYGVAQVD